MPFKSEKQRRFLWAAHPDIAKRWAHEYPTKKKLPMYANTDDKKETNSKQSAVKSVAIDIYAKLSKKADTKEVYITQPASDKPTMAGENPPQVTKAKSERCNSETKPNYGVNKLMAKLSAVLSQPIMQAIENERAELEAREAARQPANVGIKRYAMPAMGTPLPMGMQAQAPRAQPANMGSPAPSGQLPPVGGGSSPNANPINSYGALSSTGDITGNAAFGTANSVGGEKLAGILSRIIKKAAGGLDFNQWHGKAFKIVTTPPGKSVKSNTDSTPVANEPGQVSIVTPENGEAWNWPDAPAETINNFKQNWGNIQSGIAGYKMEQIQRAMMSHGAVKAQPPGSGAQTAAPTPTPPTSEPPAPPAAPEPIKTSASSPAWQRAAGKNPEGGLNEKGRKSYERETGGNLKAPVTESNPKGERAKRQNSFCSRMCGMKRVNTGAKTKSDPDSRINKSLRKWNCKCSSAMEFGAKLAQALIAK